MLLISISIVIFAVLLLPIIRNKEKCYLDQYSRDLVPGRVIKLSKGYVHYDLQGDDSGDLVVLIHGFSAPSYMWEKNVSSLTSAGYRVLTFDLYGRGYSDRPNTIYDRQLFVNQIEELTQAVVPSDKFHLIGLSMGGAIVSAYASTFPHKVLSVGYIAPFNQPVDLGALTLPVIGKWLGYSFFIPKLAANQLNDLVYPEKQLNWEKRFAEQMQYKGFRRAIIDTANNLISKDPSEDYKVVGLSGIKKLVIWGDQDKVIPVQDASRVVDMLGENTTFVLLKNAGHVLQFEAAEQVNAALLEHLARS
ncbi:alpha/beta hydrolase [Vibrio mediterranei]|nr:alpha/beta hydrolase [Vibrio mediterranei]